MTAEGRAARAARQAEDRELLRRYHERGDTGAREKLIARHLPLVRSLARRYAGRGEPLEDIEQVGAIDDLTARLGRSPSVREIAESLGTTNEEVLEALEVGSAYSALSLDAGPGGDDDGSEPMETIGNIDAEFDRSEDRATLGPALAHLPEREREILRMRFEEGLPQTQIAERVGLSQMHVSRLIRRSLAAMREELE